MPLPQTFTDALPAISAMRDANPLRNKAVVVLYLGGGADGHNSLIPRGPSLNRSAYDAARPSVRITAGTELPLTDEWGLHPNLNALKAQWDAGKLAIVANCGPLVQPTTKAQMQAQPRTVQVPVQLFSHSDQNAQWQEGRAGMGFESPTGWVGRAFDLLHTVYNNPGPLSRLQFAYSPTPALDANEAGQFTLAAGTGPVTRTLVGATAGVNAAFDAINDELATLMPVPAVQDFRVIARDGNANAVTLKAAHDGAAQAATVFPTSNIGQQLRTIVRMISAQTAIGHERSAFFAVQGGYDQHADLLTVLASNYNTLNPALDAYFAALGALGLADRVVTLIYSEFGRSLTQNGTGTDHAWGSHCYIVGQDVTGGFYGQLPDLSLNGPNMYDTRGYMIPTTSFETIYATLLGWLGIPDTPSAAVNPMKLVLPNIDNFPTRKLAGLLPQMTAG